MKKSAPHLGQARQTGDGSWTLAHPEHSEWYHSADGALSEARSLYVDSSGILGDFQRGAPGTVGATEGTIVRVLDVGLGLGYNALATIDAWAWCGGKGRVEILSLENDEALFQALRSGEAPWQVGWEGSWTDAVKKLELAGDELWQAFITGPGAGELVWRVALGDALSGNAMRHVQAAGPFDYVWQDPFSPEKNPGMWGVEWFSAIAPSVRSDGCLMTYSVARSVRDALESTGWRVEKIPTTTRKKNWLKAFRLARPGDPK
jgi:tRNA U34 5-methylaminomethyl-2-thiouridine-forming methyltransferase MnmC